MQNFDILRERHVYDYFETALTFTSNRSPSLFLFIEVQFVVLDSFHHYAIGLDAFLWEYLN